MARLMMHRQILKTFHKLPSKVQKRVPELIDEFQRDPNSPRRAHRQICPLLGHLSRRSQGGSPRV